MTQPPSYAALAWGAKVSPGFRQRVRELCINIRYPDPSDLMACMAWESGRTFSPNIRNQAGSGAVGLIQFMPQTAAALGTTTAALSQMTAIGQLDFVERYFKPWKGKLKTLSDLYCGILWPAGIGQPGSEVLFSNINRPTTYIQNKGLDLNHDGDVSKDEITAKVRAMLGEGLLPENAA